jgi:hypothetical protein
VIRKIGELEGRISESARGHAQIMEFSSKAHQEALKAVQGVIEVRTQVNVEMIN